MIESVERSMIKLREAIDTGMHLSNPPGMSKKIEGYDAKKTHYGPAIERVLAIIDKGVKDRLTVNGEILRLHAEMQSKWESIKDEMKEMDVVVDEVQADNRGQQLRDSISSMLSNDRSTIGSGRETPGNQEPFSEQQQPAAAFGAKTILVANPIFSEDSDLSSVKHDFTTGYAIGQQYWQYSPRSVDFAKSPSVEWVHEHSRCRHWPQLQTP
ncbi:hypothetical protein CGMCC3_g10756 [Colletotrichum fructicola]|nr:uncharacterized protein CGMCC3_g10756 [Colletotrichum fructicola]KAE9573302.1 hypothetical protein CGMCC3_g10756 [Colletotrichum fructicola]